MTSKRKMINIRGLDSQKDNDPFYRYKMEEVILVQQSTKISFNNIDNICKDLDRDPKMLVAYLKKYFKSNLAYKDNAVQTAKIISKSEMQNAIYSFIDKYVLCNKCKNPETVFNEEKKKTTLTCKACSFTTIVME